MNLKICFLSLFVYSIVVIGCKDKPPEVVLNPQEQYIKDHPQLSDELKKNILNKTVKIGMTESQVIACWGKPKNIKVFSSEFGSYKYWTYEGKLPKLYWKDGKVDKITK